MKQYLNTDVAEGAGRDALLIPLVGAANICCGAHAGGEAEMRAAIALCLQHGVKIGGHPGYPDRKNMGRADTDLSLSEILQSITHQLHTLEQSAHELGGKISYIKPHGALYNNMAQDYAFCCEIIDHLQSWRALPIVVLADSQAQEAAEDLGVSYLKEGFIDRAYTAEGLLVPRSDPRAMITQEEQAVTQAHALLQGTPFSSAYGTALTIQADTLCVHGDTQEALSFLSRLQYA